MDGVGDKESREVAGRGRAGRIAAAVAGALVVAGVCVLAVSCGGESDLGAAAPPAPPVGKPVLPDLMPKPQLNVLTQQVNGRWLIRFTTIIVNVGRGDFVLRATRDVRGTWKAEQDIPYSEAGAKPIRVRSPLIWGGDGHNHWHISRVAVVKLYPINDKGVVVAGAQPLTDTKVGFCFYDHTHEFARGPADPRYSAKSCGKEDWSAVGMGLSPGWNDTYLMSLPGQSIDVTGLPSGKYRLSTEIDPNGWFHEASVRNNRTWIDVDLERTPNGLSAPTIATGPRPS